MWRRKQARERCWQQRKKITALRNELAEATGRGGVCFSFSSVLLSTPPAGSHPTRRHPLASFSPVHDALQKTAVTRESFCRINEPLFMHANPMTCNLSGFSHRIFTQHPRVCVYLLAVWMIPTNNLSRTHQRYDMAGMFRWAFFTFPCDVLVMSWQGSLYSPALIFLSPPPTWIPSSSSSV